ncbi:hypothetical protein OBBRIDRAFT_827089 [Obba rivulosa]|uniref:Uncharacterized protein n=1 Tax=Obba rivulosa TaxID=1052685 RepID=A0A8E2APG9_9APHY|nr:hypothetical protein OBBRIDRAFT_827089 [Obba rivulosa]
MTGAHTTCALQRLCGNATRNDEEKSIIIDSTQATSYWYAQLRKIPGCWMDNDIRKGSMSGRPATMRKRTYQKSACTARANLQATTQNTVDPPVLGASESKAFSHQTLARCAMKPTIFFSETIELERQRPISVANETLALEAAVRRGPTQRRNQTVPVSSLYLISLRSIEQRLRYDTYSPATMHLLLAVFLQACTAVAAGHGRDKHCDQDARLVPSPEHASTQEANISCDLPQREYPSQLQVLASLRQFSQILVLGLFVPILNVLEEIIMDQFLVIGSIGFSDLPPSDISAAPATGDDMPLVDGDRIWNYGGFCVVT